MRRLNFHTEIGANTAVMMTAQISDCPIVPATGTPLSSPRTASATIVTGFTLTQACSQRGMVDVGTKTLLVNVNGKVNANPKISTISGLPATTPTSTASQESASEKTST